MEELWKQMTNLENPADSTLELPQVINIKHGILLPEVDIKEKRVFVDYATFHDFDIHRDREGYNKMDITLREYLMSQGFIVHDDSTAFTVGPYAHGYRDYLKHHNQELMKRTILMASLIRLAIIAHL